MQAITRCSRILASNAAATPSRMSSRSLPSIGRRPYSTPTDSDDGMDEGERNIYKKLSKRFETSKVQVQDVSGGCGTFYAIEISSKAFAGLPIVKQHRLVNETLKSEISGIHGLQLKTTPDAPDEA